jgi:hypothetical protein
MWVETMTKAATDAALDAVEARVKVIPKELTDLAKKQKDEIIEWAGEEIAKKGVEYARSSQMFVIRQAGLDPMSFDTNGDQMLSDTELSIGVQKAKESDKLPWWLYLVLSVTGTGATGGIFSYIKTARRRAIGIEANGGKKKA